MKIGSQSNTSSGISSSNATTIVVRGRDLTDDLIGGVDFTSYFWILLTGKVPSAAQRAVLDATLVAIAEHGMVPSVQAARMTLAAAPEALQGAVAAGLLGCGTVVLGSSEAAGRLFASIAANIDSGATLDAAALSILSSLREKKQPIPGYGHPLHKGSDPRAVRLFQIASDNAVAGRYVEIARAVERLIPSVVGKELSLNVSGAIPSVLLDAGYPLAALKGVPLLARTAGLIAHLLEEQLRPIGFLMSHAAAAAVDYDGPMPVGFVPSHG